MFCITQMGCHCVGLWFLGRNMGADWIDLGVTDLDGEVTVFPRVLL